MKHYFIRDYVQKGILDIKFISTENHLVDIFTKPLPKDKLIHIRNLLGMTFIQELSLKSYGLGVHSMNMDLEGKGVKKNHMMHSTFITKIFSNQKVLKAFHALPIVEQVRYGYSFWQQRFGRSNIMPMKLDTIKPIPLLNIKPTKAELAVAVTKASKRLASKCAVTSSKASTKKRKLVFPSSESDEEVTIETRPPAMVEEYEEADKEEVPLVTRTKKESTLWGAMIL
ncbi:Copia protein, partial [Mucuna pruriens]